MADSSRSHSETPQSLLERLRSPNDANAAIEEFSRRYSGLLQRWCLNWGIQHHDANDVIQETMIEVMAGLKHFEHRGLGSFRGWMRIIARRCWLRIRRRQQRLGSTSEADQKILSQMAYEELATDLEHEAQREIMKLAMSRVCQRVKPQTWNAFNLFLHEPLSGKEVMEKTGLSLSSVYTAKLRVQRMISEELEKLSAEDEFRPPTLEQFEEEGIDQTPPRLGGELPRKPSPAAFDEQFESDLEPGPA